MDKATLSGILSIGGTLTLLTDFLAGLLIIVIVVSLLVRKRIPVVSSINDFIADNFVALGFVLATTAMFGSLFMSEIAGLTPCELCWFQRICMYPQSLIFGVALFTNDIKIKKYCLPLSVIGALVAIYHICVQSFPLLFKCSDKTANCALVQFKYYGYVTIPVMSLTAFVMLILVMVAQKRVFQATKRGKK